MKRLLAVLCASAFFTVSVWSQRPRTGFSDLKRSSSISINTIVKSSRQPESFITPDDRDEDNNNEDGVWGCTSFVNIGYAYDQSLKIGATDYGYKAQWGAGLQVGNSYMYPKEAFFDILKIAVDATWFDFSGAKYDDPGNNRYQFTAGMGVGASLHIAPLAHMTEVLRPLRIECYGRFIPSCSILFRKSKIKDIVEEDGEVIVKESKVVANGAFVPMLSFGIGVDYRAIGIGYEHCFGNARYKGMVEGAVDTRYDMTSDRLYISLRM